jgi:hypothetical protein
MILNEKEKNQKYENKNIEIIEKYIFWTHDSNSFILPFIISQLQEDFKHQKFKKVKTQSSFRLKNHQLYIFDVYHNKSQFELLSEGIKNKISFKVDELLETLKLFTKKKKDSNTFFVCSEFANQEFIDQVMFKNNLQNEIQKKEKIVSAYLLKKIKKLKKFDSFKSKIELLYKSSLWTLASISKALKISKSFLKYSIILLMNPEFESNEKKKIESELFQIESDNQKFLSFFKANNIKFKTMKLLFQNFKNTYPDIQIKSLSTFDRKFIKKNGISNQKCKLIYYQRNEQHKEECRLIFIDHLFGLIKKKESLFFFDETIFEINSKSFRTYSFKGIKPKTQVNIQPIYLKILMIVSFDRTEAIYMSYSPVLGKDVTRFIKQFVFNEQKKRDYPFKSISLVMDNSPKNRMEDIKKLANEKFINLIYTVPCSPFTNFIESVFNLLKREIQKDIYYPFK